MPEAKEGDSVKVQYVGKLEDGSIFDSSAPDAPLEFTIGGNQVIPGFNNGVLGMTVGESKTVHIPVTDASNTCPENNPPNSVRNPFKLRANPPPAIVVFFF